MTAVLSPQPASEPVVRTTEGPEAAERVERSLAGPVSAVMALGFLLMSMTAAMSREGDVARTTTDTAYWLSLVLIFLPAAWRIVAARTPGPERVLLALLMPLLMLGTRALLHPLHFVFHDELAHENTLRLIETTGHLFAVNPLLPASSSYPGLEIATSGVQALTGLADRPAALVVLALARFAMTSALLGFVLTVSGSLRLACLASLLYACNPQFVFFNSQYSYQTLSLPLAVVALHLIARRAKRLRRFDLAGVRSSWSLLPLLVAIAVTHHLTAMLLIGFLVLWCLAELVCRGRSARSDLLALLTIVASAIVVLWAVRPGNTVVDYLTTIAESSASDVQGLASGKDEERALFADGSGEKTPQWQQLALLASLGLLIAALLPALWWARRYWRARLALPVLLCLVGAAYPVIPAGHLTPATSEVTDRASGFLFVGVGFLLAAWFLRWPLRRRLVALPLTLLIGVVFVGQSVLGSGPPWSRTPGPFLVSADSRSVDSDNLAAAQWQAANLPPGQRVLADRVGRLLSGAIGGQYPVTHLADGIDASQVLLGERWTPRDRELIQLGRLDYVVDDERNCTDLPRIGVYYENGELDGDGRTEPVTCAALTKLAGVRAVNRLYDNGSVVVYDVRALQ